MFLPVAHMDKKHELTGAMTCEVLKAFGLSMLQGMNLTLSVGAFKSEDESEDLRKKLFKDESEDLRKELCALKGLEYSPENASRAFEELMNEKPCQLPALLKRHLEARGEPAMQFMYRQLEALGVRMDKLEGRMDHQEQRLAVLEAKEKKREEDRARLLPRYLGHFWNQFCGRDQSVAGSTFIDGVVACFTKEG